MEIPVALWPGFSICIAPQRCASKAWFDLSGAPPKNVFPIPVATGVKKKLRRKPDDGST
jgi:hypothetical protein